MERREEEEEDGLEGKESHDPEMLMTHSLSFESDSNIYDIRRCLF